MQRWRVARIVSLAVALLLPGAIAAAAAEPLPPVTPFIDSAPVPVPPSKPGSGADAGQPPITPFLDSAPIPPHPSRWYGGKILAADLGTLGCIALTQSGACLFPYLFAGTAIHMFHGRPGRAGLSVALRLFVPAIGMMGGGLIGGCYFSEQSRDTDFHPCLGEAVAGMLVGVAAGMAIDAALGFTPPPAPVADSPARAAVRLAPRLSLSQAHLTFGLSATF